MMCNRFLPCSTSQPESRLHLPEKGRESSLDFKIDQMSRFRRDAGLYPGSHRGPKQAPFPIAISSKSCRIPKFCNLLLQFLFTNVLFLSQFLQKRPLPKTPG